MLIAILKDVPDMKGDELYDVPSFALIFGRASILKFSGLTLSALLVITAVMLRSYVSIGALIMSLFVQFETHAALRLNTPESSSKFYGFLWQCFYLCYVALFLV